MIKKQYLKNKATCKVTFSLPKEAVNGAKEVKILGEFNNWDRTGATLMKAGKTDYKAVLELTAGRNYQFRYLIDNENWANDWAADDYVPTPFGVENSVVFIDSIETAVKTPVKKTTKKAAPKKATAKKAPVKKVTPAKKATPAAKKVTKDNLKKIEGIGPKIEKLLNAQDIKTFADLAKAKKTLLKSILAEAGSRFKMHDPTTWAQQAKLAAKGDWDKLTKLQDELKGGKR